MLLLGVGVSGLEPEKAGPESAVLPLHHTPMLLTPPPYPGKRLLNKFVGVPGLEPGKAGPESAVLPLHHTPIKHKKWSVPGSIALEYGCKSSTLLQTRQILRHFFSNNLSNGYPEQAVMSRCPKLVRYKMVPYPYQWTN